MRHRDARNILYEYVRGELDAVAEKQVEHHVAGCDRCFADLQVLKESIRLLKPRIRRPSEDRSETYWHNFVVRVEQRLQADRKRRPLRRRLWDEAEWFFLFRRPYAVALATSTAIVVLAAILWFGRVRPEMSEHVMPPGSAAAVQQVNQELGDYLRRSKILLVGISNMSVPDAQRFDLSVERETARALVTQARYFDRQPIDERTQLLINALEKILVELANLDDEVDLPDVEIVRAGINQENMLFKIRMAEATYRNSPGNGFSRTTNNRSYR